MVTVGVFADLIVAVVGAAVGAVARALPLVLVSHLRQ